MGEARAHSFRSPAGHGCGCGGGEEGEDAPEPTQDEFRNAVGEASQRLQELVEEINECLEELRYLLADERGEES